MFRPLAPREVRWRPISGDGLQHLHVEATPDGVVARGVVIGQHEGRRFGLGYQIRTDARWRVRSLAVRDVAGATLSLVGDGAGNWRQADGTDRPDLAGAIDVDLSGTPFTNTLPIRRLDLVTTGETAELTMVYVPFDTLEPFLDGQRYTCIAPGRLYRYQATDGTFSADLPVDEDGLVTDYPTLFTRV